MVLDSKNLRVLPSFQANCIFAAIAFMAIIINASSNSRHQYETVANKNRLVLPIQPQNPVCKHNLWPRNHSTDTPFQEWNTQSEFLHALTTWSHQHVKIVIDVAIWEEHKNIYIHWQLKLTTEFTNLHKNLRIERAVIMG